MTDSSRHQGFRGISLTLFGSLTLALATHFTALAQTSNFGEITLSGGFGQTETEGQTAGFYQLANISNRDRANNLCLGFADSTPDHILKLQQDFETLTISVESDGSDTTLLIQGPNDNSLRCNDNASRRSRDAAISDRFQAGNYRVWVGSFDAGEAHNYILSLTE